MRFQPRLVALVLTAAACDPSITGHVEPGSRPDSLVIHAFRYPDSVTGGQSVYRIAVSACEPTRGTLPVVWEIEQAKVGSDSRETRFLYGGPVARGWITAHDAEPLTPGCYLLDIQGGGIGHDQWLVVDSTGAITTFAEQPQSRRRRTRAGPPTRPAI